MSFAMFDGLQSMIEASRDPSHLEDAKKYQNSDGTPNFQELYCTAVYAVINIANAWMEQSEESAHGRITEAQAIDRMDEYVFRKVPAIAVMQEHVQSLRENRAPDFKTALRKVFGI